MEMDNTQGGSDQELAKYRSFIAGQLKSKTDQSEITKRLVEMGVSESTAQQMVLTVQGEVMVSGGSDALVSTAIPMGIVGGVLAALIGGLIWGYVVKLTGYEIGYMAWGIGVLCGFAVLLFAGGKKGLPLQIIAVLCSVLGIALGQYASFVFELRAYGAEHGMPQLAEVPFFSVPVFKLFLSALKDLFSPFQILWVVLAVGSAWGILNPHAKPKQS